MSPRFRSMIPSAVFNFTTGALSKWRRKAGKEAERMCTFHCHFSVHFTDLGFLLTSISINVCVYICFKVFLALHISYIVS